MDQFSCGFFLKKECTKNVHCTGDNGGFETWLQILQHSFFEDMALNLLLNLGRFATASPNKAGQK